MSPKETRKSPYWRERPYACKQCGKRFNQSCNLRRHERVHREEKPYECKQCGKRFNHLCNLTTHERVHTGEKPYVCKQCGKCFRQAGNLRIHTRVHTGEKPYECKQCGKCFTQLPNLSTHERVHTEEKPSKSKRRGRCFNETGNLRKHEKRHLHTRERTHGCEQLNSECSRRTGGRKGQREATWCKITSLRSKKTKIQNRTHGRSSPVNNGAEENSQDNSSTPTSGFQGPQSGHVEKHICWICQEEMSSEALLLEHYENHMRY